MAGSADSGARARETRFTAYRSRMFLGDFGSLLDRPIGYIRYKVGARWRICVGIEVRTPHSIRTNVDVSKRQAPATERGGGLPALCRYYKPDIETTISLRTVDQARPLELETST
jgi:hypothetical protein